MRNIVLDSNTILSAALFPNSIVSQAFEKAQAAALNVEPAVLEKVSLEKMS